MGVTLRSNAVDGAIAVNLGQLQGNLAGTAQNTFAVGNNTAGIKALQLKNGFTSQIQANPTAARTWSLPDVNGTLAANEMAATYQPEDHNLGGWTFDPDIGVQNAPVAMTPAGTLHVARLRVLRPVITNIHFHVGVPGSALVANQCYAAVFNDAGVMIGINAITASLHGTGVNGWGDGGAKTHPLTTPQAVTQYGWYKIVWWFNGTTGPAMSRASNSGSAIVNIGLTASTARFATANTGITTSATLPGTLGAQTGGSTAWFVGVS